jgi:hypothetical protein
MKKFLIALWVCASAGPLVAEMKLPAKSWRGLQAYDVRTLSEDMGKHMGELVELRFNFRGKDINRLKSSWYESSLWQPNTNGKKGFSDVRVMVNAKDLKNFKSLPTDAGSSEEMTIYGRILRDNEAKFVFVRLIGRKAVTDAQGNATISW